MAEASYQLSLWNSVIAGFAAGIAVSIVVGAYARISRYLLRRDQIRYIRKVLSDGMDRINDVDDPRVTIPITPNGVRDLYYKAMRRVLTATLQSRASEIKPEEIMGLNEHLLVIDWLIDEGKLAPKEYYDEAFANIRAMKWLGLNK